MPRKFIILLIFLISFTSACSALAYNETTLTLPAGAQSPLSEWFQVYFSDPGGANSRPNAAAQMPYWPKLFVMHTPASISPSTI
ncbi:MAG: hypothetical protein HOL47_05965 [Chloroflexi bacterium]|nr:hypothetical protein [Chloroflexota bacterium]